MSNKPLKALCCTIFLALGFQACGQTTGNSPTPATTDGMQPVAQEIQLSKDIGEILLVGFRGTSINEQHHIVRDIRKYHVGSVILFEYDAPSGTRHRNVESPKQLKNLCHDLQKYAQGNLLIGVDQEGGNVARLRTKDGFPSTLSAQESAKGGAAAVESNAMIVAKELAEAGINLNFAPCVDVNVNPSCPVIGKMGRSFSNKSNEVTDYARIWIQTQNKQGVLSCLKHFPGHGSATGDTHAGLVDVSKSWQEDELVPYRQLIATDDVDMVMVAHVINSQMGDNLPASLSPQVVTEKLRNQLGFEGVIVTDDLAMGAITKQYGFEEAIKMALLAGCDMLCLSNNAGKYDPDMVPRAVEAIQEFVATGELSAEAIHASAERIRQLKKKILK